MANKKLSDYAETTAIEDTDLIAISKDSGDGLWRHMTGASLKSNQGTFPKLNSQDSALTIADDAASSIEFGGDANGVIVISADTTAGGVAMIHAVIGTSPATSILSSDIDAGSVAVTTGVLAGTTGTDTNLTISTHTDNKLYIENRTGAQHTYQVAFVAMQGSDVSSL